MTPLPDSLLEAVASAAVREGLADAIFTRLSTPIGRLLVVQGPNGIVRIGFEEEPEDALLADVAAALGPRVIGSDRELAGARDALSAYLEGDADALDLPGRPRARRTPRSGARCSRRCTTRSAAARSSPTASSPSAPGNPRASRAAGDRLRPQPGPDRRALPPRAARARAGSATTAAGRSASGCCWSSRALCSAGERQRRWVGRVRGAPAPRVSLERSIARPEAEQLPLACEVGARVAPPLPTQPQLTFA